MASCPVVLNRLLCFSLPFNLNKSVIKCTKSNYSSFSLSLSNTRKGTKGTLKDLSRIKNLNCNWSGLSLNADEYVFKNSQLFNNCGNGLNRIQKRYLWNIFKSEDFGNYAKINHMSLGEVTEPYPIPDYIDLPPYALSGEPSPSPTEPEIKTEEMIEGMRDACKLARTILNIVGEDIKVGMTTDDIDFLVHTSVVERGCYPSPLNYRGFPKSVCTSVNNVACHGIPDDRPLDDGDIISVDVTVFYNGFHGDCCETFLIGEVDSAGVQLVNAARRCRDEAIKICKPGVYFSDIGNMIMSVARRENVTIVPAFIGHGIGSYFHGPPDIYHCLNNYPGKMKSGMTFTIEPIVAQGTEEIIILEDGWTAMTMDDGRAAQFEHTVLITDDAHEILTDYF